MFDWFNDPAFHLFGAPTSWGEVLGFVTGLWTVWLVVRQHIANWPIGIANVLLLLAVFWSAGLYGDASLQVVYVVLGFYGWWQWRFGGAGRGERHVRLTTAPEWIGQACAGVVLVALLWYFLGHFTDSTVPFADAVTTALSLLATFGQSRKLLENWWLWIAADLVYIPLYAYKHLWLTAILYVVFALLCVVGLREWNLDRVRVRPVAVT